VDSEIKQNTSDAHTEIEGSPPSLIGSTCPIDESWKLLTDQEHDRMLEIDMNGGGSCYQELIV
jgi:hypothetical protein